MKQTNGAPIPWRTKYQVEGLNDGEYLNLRDMYVYCSENGKMKKQRKYNTRRQDGNK